MLFNSFEFVLLVLVTFGLYYLPQFRPAQTFVLIAASLFFYAFNQPALVLLLLASIAINAVASFKILHASHAIGKKSWATAGVVSNLALLGFYKYTPLLAGLAGVDRENAGPVGQFLLTIPLPIGISFFTFQGISLLIDVFRQTDASPQRILRRSVWRHFVDTAFFEAFFPQLVAGPIVKAHEFFPQIRPKAFSEIKWESVFRALVTGYCLKMVVADNLKDLTYWIAYPYFLQASTLTLVSMLVGYSMQIFADFAGYSLIAIGLARLFGYELIENFNFPYIAQSLSEFWRRWHISLSSWLREYLYYPLGGNRRGEFRTYVNLIVVMTLGGLWHGAAWSYAAWGLFHGAGLAVERWWQRGRNSAAASFSPLRVLFVFSYVTFGWLLFKLPNFEHVIAFVRACFDNTGLRSDTRLIAFILLYSLPVVAYHALAVRRARAGWKVPVGWQQLAYAVGLVALLINSGSPGAFIYFQF